jgi:hypothetical protein
MMIALQRMRTKDAPVAEAPNSPGACTIAPAICGDWREQITAASVRLATAEDADLLGVIGPAAYADVYTYLRSTAAARATMVLVPDVHSFPGHIACDPVSRSELVVPLIEAGEVSGVLDLDSPLIGRFDATERAGRERFVALFVDHHHRFPEA